LTPFAVSAYLPSSLPAPPVKDDPAMQLIAPDLLEPLVGFSLAGCIIGLVVGGALWLGGWWAHRFWIVLFATVAAGWVGLRSSTAGMSPLVAGVLLAVSAGMMALALARVVAFVAGGAAVLLVVPVLLPAWDDHLLAFFSGGLVGLLLFRWWMMTLTSLGGTLVASYAALLLLDRSDKLDAVAWAEERATLLNWIVIGGTLMGVFTQYLLARWLKKLHKQREEEDQIKRAEMELEQRLRKRSWWKRGGSEREAA